MHQAKLTVTNVWELLRAGFTSLFVREIDGCAMNAVRSSKAVGLASNVCIRKCLHQKVRHCERL